MRCFLAGNSHPVNAVVISLILLQGSHRSWKVIEFDILDSKPGKSWNKFVSISVYISSTVGRHVALVNMTDLAHLSS